MWRIFCRKTFCGRHTISLVEVLTCQANPLLDSHRAALAPSHTAGDRARRRQSLTETLVSREMGAAACTVAFRPAQKRRKDGPAHSQPYAPAGQRGGSDKVRAFPEYSWPSSNWAARQHRSRHSIFDVRFRGISRPVREGTNWSANSQIEKFDGVEFRSTQGPESTQNCRSRSMARTAAIGSQSSHSVAAIS